MESRNKILKRVKQNQPALRKEGSAVAILPQHFPDVVEKFKDTLQAIGGAVVEINSWAEISTCVNNLFPDKKREIIYLPKWGEHKMESDKNGNHFATVDLVVLKGELAVAENAAVWITEKNMLNRALPFICERLVLVIHSAEIVETLHEAYQKIKTTEYQFGTFIAGPSKTADIEQSLVLGAHGPKTLTVLLVMNYEL